MDLMIGVVLSLGAAIVPTVLYALAFYFADRYEREPVWLIALAFLWGAVPAVIASLIGELAIGAPMVNAPGSIAEALVETAVVAPLIEEITKGLALYLVYRLFRQEFDGVLDGVTYGAIIGFGFAMTENFFYFVGAFGAGGFVELTITIILRAVIFGLNHAFYTGLLGIGLGLARHSRQRSARYFWIIAGFSAAVAAHALHNFGASISGLSSVGLVLSLGLAALGVGLVVLAIVLTWQQERRWLRIELFEEIGTALSSSEYRALVDRTGPPGAVSSTAGTREYQRRVKLLTELAFRKHRLRRLGPKREPRLAQQIESLRQQLRTSTPR